jgi:hypothetical protein
MVITTNLEAKKEEFEKLLADTLQELKSEAKVNHSEFSKNTGRKLELIVFDLMKKKAIGTIFDNTIIHIGGQKFPDIVAKEYYGVEVKSTIGEHWQTVGNSVMEGTRVEGVEKIYLLFGRFNEKIDFRIRPYEECLSEVVVTHSPRYWIDMELGSGNTIFDKINIGYDELRLKENPAKPIIDYYRENLGKGESLWWLDTGEEPAVSNISVKVWSTLPKDKQHELQVKAMAFFPDIFSNNPKKYSKLGIWLITEESVVSPSLRDKFSSGGKAEFYLGRKKYTVPKIIKHLKANFPEIVELIRKTPSEVLESHWGVKPSSKKINTWLRLFEENIQKVIDTKKIPIVQIITEQ